MQSTLAKQGPDQLGVAALFEKEKAAELRLKTIDGDLAKKIERRLPANLSFGVTDADLVKMDADIAELKRKRDLACLEHENWRGERTRAEAAEAAAMQQKRKAAVIAKVEALVRDSEKRYVIPIRDTVLPYLTEVAAVTRESDELDELFGDDEELIASFEELVGRISPAVADQTVEVEQEENEATGVFPKRPSDLSAGREKAAKHHPRAPRDYSDEAIRSFRGTCFARRRTKFSGAWHGEAGVHHQR